MGKERFLTVMVPITDADVTPAGESALGFPSLAALEEAFPPSARTADSVFLVDGDGYRRARRDASTGAYSYETVTDREFPRLGAPLEIYDFTYEATRMGTAPTISAQGVMWYAERGEDGAERTLEGLWRQECHVVFNGERFFLRQIPTAAKSNEDARYRYDIDFVSERVVLERVYLYDVVRPFASSRPVSESASFSFYGDVAELAKRVNASLLRSGLARVALRPGVEEGSYLTFEEFNAVGLGTYEGGKDTSDPFPAVTGEMQSYLHYPHENVYEHFGGNYTKYLLNLVYEVDSPKYAHIGPADGGYDEVWDGVPRMSGYRCVLGTDAKGNPASSEEKLISFDNNTVHEALQQVHEAFGLQYYICGDGDGGAVITVGDCQHDFADALPGGGLARGDDGIPVSSSPFDYGVDGALLSKEKSNTTDTVVTRATGTGSTENIPWYYPNPCADGWIRPAYVSGGEERPMIIDYPRGGGETPAEEARYEKYLGNRVGDAFVYGRKVATVFASMAADFSEDAPMYVDNDEAMVGYGFYLEDEAVFVSEGFSCSFPGAEVSFSLYRDGAEVTSPGNAFVMEGGRGTLPRGIYYAMFRIAFTSGGPSAMPDVSLYYYPAKYAWCTPAATWGWRMLLNVLTGVLSLSALRTIAASFVTINSHIPAFVSSDPSLRFVDSEDARVLGWYSGTRRISAGEMTRPQKGEEVFVFKGGDGPKSPMEADCYSAVFDGTMETGNLQMLGYDPGDWGDTKMYFLNVSYLKTPKATFRDCKGIEKVDVAVHAFISEHVSFSAAAYRADGWYRGGRRVSLADYGIGGEDALSSNAEVGDTVEFRRVKYVTPQRALMPELYIRTDGERRFYEAKDYFRGGALVRGTADPALGEEQDGEGVRNPIYKADAGAPDSAHYAFENECVPGMPMEHIGEYEDVRPTIEGQTHFVPARPSAEEFLSSPERYFTRVPGGGYAACSHGAPYGASTAYYVRARVDVVEEFAYDMLDSDEIWESSDGGNVGGEYKHPFFYARLRPLGFNLFDLALQEDMSLSMKTGDCGACTFRIGVDQNTGKNPVEIWEHDVYGGATYAARGPRLHAAGELRRYCDDSSLRYDTDGTEGGYVPVSGARAVSRAGFSVSDAASRNPADFVRTAYTAAEVASGAVGSLKKDPKTHFEGDVRIGRICAAQQDTTDGFVWVALYKDTETYGTPMPSARPDYGDGAYSMYTEPRGCSYRDRKTGEESYPGEDGADKFVLLNIRMPQKYIRAAERELSRRIVAHMYENNYQKFNFSIGFSRIFLAEHPEVESVLNENSVLYVSFDGKSHRQYARHYTYRMERGAALPEISVEMNEELSVTRSSAAQRTADASAVSERIGARMRRDISEEIGRLRRTSVGIGDDVLFSGNFVSRDAAASMSDVSAAASSVGAAAYGTRIALENDHFKKSDFEVFGGTDLRIGDRVFLPTAHADGHRIVRRRWDGEKFADDPASAFAPAFISGGSVSDYAVSASGEYAAHTITPARQRDMDIVRHTVERRFLEKGFATESPTCGDGTAMPVTTISTVTVDGSPYLFWTTPTGDNISYNGSGNGQCQTDPF